MIKRNSIDIGRRDLNSLIHLNNFIFLIFSLCTDWVYNQNHLCKDVNTEGFLYFVLYGNVIVYGIIFAMQTLYSLGLLELCTRKLGAVCITINTIIFVGGVCLFDLLSMVKEMNNIVKIYGIHTHFFTDTSQCKDLQLFTMCCAYVFLVWFIALTLGQLAKQWKSYKGDDNKARYNGIL